MKSEIRILTGEECLLRNGARADDSSSFGFRHSIVIRISSFVIFTFALVIQAGLPLNAPACATCYGASDSPLAQGMNWGIISLLGFIGSVLVGIVIFFAYIIRRAARLEDAGHLQIQTDPHP